MADSPLSEQQAWQPYKSHPLRQVVGANGLNPIQATETNSIKRTGDDYIMRTTTNFAEFGWREREMAEVLLRASREQGFPEDFEDSGVTIMMNKMSGNVFFTNEEYQVAMMNGDKLESFYTLPYSGEEGFKDELLELDQDTLNAEDIEYINSL